MKRVQKYVMMLTVFAMILVMCGGTALAAKVKGVNFNAPTVVVKNAYAAFSVYPNVQYEEWDDDDAYEVMAEDFQKKAKVTLKFSKKGAKKVSGKNTYSQRYKFTKTGTYKVTATVKYGGKTYKKTCKVLVLAKSPVKSITWGSKLSVDKNAYTLQLTNSKASQQLIISASKGWKVNEIMYGYYTEDGDYEIKNVSNKSTIPYSSKPVDATVVLQKGKDVYNYHIGRYAYNTYVLNYKKMVKGSEIRVWYKFVPEDERTLEVAFKYNKKATSKKPLEFKSASDFCKKFKNYMGTDLVRVSKKGSKITIKLPYFWELELLKPGAKTTLVKK